MYNFASDGVPHHTHKAVVESDPTGSGSKSSGNGGTIIVLIILVVVVAVTIYFYRRSDK